MWYVLYKLQNVGTALSDKLNELGVKYYVPMHYIEKLNSEGTMMEQQKVVSISNLLFVNTDMDILQFTQQTNGLLAPMKDTMTNKPAVVKDEEMGRFIPCPKLQPANVLLRKDPGAKFRGKTKVRVKAGLFEGIEGRVVRILRDRRLVISLGNMAVAISGIHPSLLEQIP